MTEKFQYFDLPAPIRRAVEQFQGYVAEQYHSRSTQWTRARESIVAIADRINDVVGLEDAPIDLRPIVHLFGVRVYGENGSPHGVRGQLVPTNEGFAIRVSGLGSPYINTRSRFTIAHELGHLFFYSLRSTRPERIIPIQRIGVSTVHRKEEGLCDAFAAALLAPGTWVAGLGNQQLAMADIIRYASQLRITPDVLIRRILYDFGHLPDTVIYAIRETPSPSVNIFRGLSRKTHRSAPTARYVSDLIQGKPLNEAIAELRQHESFARAEFSLYQRRVLYLMVWPVHGTD